MPMFLVDPDGHDRMHMEMQERALRMTRFMDEMSADDAFTFFQIITTISNSSDPAEVANYVAGQMHMMLRRIHKVCTNCGERHEPVDHDEWEMSKSKKEGEGVEEAQENTTEIPGSTSTPPEDTD